LESAAAEWSSVSLVLVFSQFAGTIPASGLGVCSGSQSTSNNRSRSVSPRAQKMTVERLLRIEQIILKSKERIEKSKERIELNNPNSILSFDFLSLSCKK